MVHATHIHITVDNDTTCNHPNTRRLILSNFETQQIVDYTNHNSFKTVIQDCYVLKRRLSNNGHKVIRLKVESEKYPSVDSDMVVKYIEITFKFFSENELSIEKHFKGVNTYIDTDRTTYNEMLGMIRIPSDKGILKVLRKKITGAIMLGLLYSCKTSYVLWDSNVELDNAWVNSNKEELI